jgi:hypothetical protein
MKTLEEQIAFLEGEIKKRQQLVWQPRAARRITQAQQMQEFDEIQLLKSTLQTLQWLKRNREQIKAMRSGGKV